MSKNHTPYHRRTSVWLVIGVIVLIVLLLVWLTVADFSGDTDVAATMSPISFILEPSLP